MARSVLSPARILVVDDERSYRTYVAAVLRSQGYAIHTSACASEALTAWETEGGFDLVVSDLQMPGMDGLQLRDELQRRRPGARVLVISAGGSNRPGVICKPVTYQSLFALIDAALSTRSRPGVVRQGQTIAPDKSR